MSAILTPAMQAFDAWWRAQTRVGDTSRRTHLTRDAFYAGWQAALETHPSRDERKAALHDTITLGSIETPESEALSFNEVMSLRRAS